MVPLLDPIVLAISACDLLSFIIREMILQSSVRRSSCIVSFSRRNATGVRFSGPNIFLRRKNPPVIWPWYLKLSHEAIYQHIADDKKFGNYLAANLRIKGKRRYRRQSRIGRVGKIPNRVDLAKRPTDISKRKRIGTVRPISFKEGQETISCPLSMNVKAVSGNFTNYLLRVVWKP